MLREFYLAIETLAAPGCGSLFTHIKDPASHSREKPDLYFFVMSISSRSLDTA